MHPLAYAFGLVGFQFDDEPEADLPGLGCLAVGGADVDGVFEGGDPFRRGKGDAPGLGLLWHRLLHGCGMMPSCDRGCRLAPSGWAGGLDGIQSRPE